MKNWKVYFTQPGRDSELVYNGPAESFKHAISKSGLYHRAFVDELEVERTSFTYGINGSTFSTKPKMFLVAKAGQYEGMNPIVKRPETYTLPRDIAVWDGFATDLEDAIEQSRIPKAIYQPLCSQLNCDATYVLVDRNTYYALWDISNLDSFTISLK